MALQNANQVKIQSNAYYKTLTHLFVLDYVSCKLSFYNGDVSTIISRILGWTNKNVQFFIFNFCA